MTTTITPSEIKLIYIELMLVAIVGVFLFFYLGQPITTTNSVETDARSQNETSSPSWITELMTPDLGLPIGVSEIIIVSSIFLVPLTIMNSLVAIRYIKDLISGWI